MQGILGIPGANGTFVVTGSDPDAGTFELEDTDATGTYLGGGTWRLLHTPEDMSGHHPHHAVQPVGLLAGRSADVVLQLSAGRWQPPLPTIWSSVSIVQGSGTPQPLVVKGAGLLSSLPGTGDPPQPLWRQARVELSDYANLDDLRLLFTFDKAGGTVTTIEGFLIDDIIIGFAERGEMVSYAYNDPTFTVNPDSETTDALTGPYQLELRPGTDPGPSQRPTAAHPNSQVLERAFDTNERLARQTTLVPPAGSDIADGDTFTISDGVSDIDVRVRQQQWGRRKGTSASPFTTSFTSAAGWPEHSQCH